MRSRTRYQQQPLPLPLPGGNGHRPPPPMVWDAVPIATDDPLAVRIVARPLAAAERDRHDPGWRPLLPPIGYPWPGRAGPFPADQAPAICDHLAANGPPPGWSHGHPYTRAQLPAAITAARS